MDCYTIDEEPAQFLHLPHPVGLGYISLCGWCDVSYKIKRGKPTCPSCLYIVKYCKGLRKSRLTGEG